MPFRNNPVNKDLSPSAPGVDITTSGPHEVLWEPVGKPFTGIGTGRFKLTATTLFFEKGALSLNAQQNAPHEAHEVACGADDDDRRLVVLERSLLSRCVLAAANETCSTNQKGAPERPSIASKQQLSVPNVRLEPPSGPAMRRTRKASVKVITPARRHISVSRPGLTNATIALKQTSNQDAHYRNKGNCATG